MAQELVVVQVVQDLPVADRHRFLASICRDDDALRAEVESLLAHDEPESLIEEAPAPPPPRPSLAPGVQVGEYVIESELGSGAFGTVYRASHPVIGKLAAVKVINAEYSANEEIVARFVAVAVVRERVAVQKVASRTEVE